MDTAVAEFEPESLFGPVISVYSRAQAIEDGVLVDVSEMARETGIRFPVALTQAAWTDCVAWSEDDTRRKRWPQDEAGRLWDVVWMLRCAIRASAGGTRIAFSVLRVPCGGRGHMPRKVQLIADCGPGDTPEPVITVGFGSDF